MDADFSRRVVSKSKHDTGQCLNLPQHITGDGNGAAGIAAARIADAEKIAARPYERAECAGLKSQAEAAVRLYLQTWADRKRPERFAVIAVAVNRVMASA